jgi:hypothetical protein
MKNHVPLCMAIVDALLVFEKSAPGEMDPDIAVRAMESMSSSLQQLDLEDQRALRRLFYEIAKTSGDVAYGDFVRAVPDMMGLE